MKPIITILLIALICGYSQAQIFVKHDASGNNDGTSWSNAFTNLQDALDASASGAQVWIASGRYVPQGPTPDSSHFIATHPVQLYGGFAGTETSLSQRDWNVNLSIVSGDILGDDIPGNFVSNRTDNAHHVLIINAPNTESVIDGLVFESGTTKLDCITCAPNASDIPYNRWQGGALYLYQSGAVIRNCLFHNNDSGVRGSGCYAFGDTLHTIALHFDNVIFRDNHGYNGAGGFFHAYQDLSLKNCHFSNNSGFQGGAAFFSGTNATVEDCVFEANSATYGGGIDGFHTNLYIKYPVIRIIRSSFTGNTSLSGGGVYYRNDYGGFSFVVDSCIFTENESSSSGGGALYIIDNADAQNAELTSTVRVDRTTFTGNAAVYGGAVEIDGGDDSLRIEVARSGFFNNTASDSGGGLYVFMQETSNVHTQIKQTTFDGNTAPIGGGLILDSYYNIERMSYAIDSCNFSNNVAGTYGGAIGQFLTEGPGLIGSIRNTQFLNNQARQAGALVSLQEMLLMDNCLFSDNYASGYDTDVTGGGAIIFAGPADINVRNTIFEKNRSDVEGSAVYSAAGVNARYDNVLFHDNHGISTFDNRGASQLVNATMANNDSELLLQDSSSIEIQNSIFNNTNGNLRIEGTPQIISNGGNLSSDATMTDFLTGSGGYQDFNNTDPLLGLDFYPLAGSPAIDGGNITGIITPTDLAGDPRVQGNTIDIGSYESLFTGIMVPQWNSLRLFVFPSPVTDQINFKLEDEWLGKIQIKMYDNLGRLVFEDTRDKSASVQQFTINNLQLLPGEYFMMVQSNLKTYGNKLIVQ